tara:strand:+ start:168 stop:326 length:159 start_codon:yes stop_codon:yes gene_type:complete
MDEEIELRRLCTNLALELLSKGRNRYKVDLGRVVEIAKTYYALSRSLSIVID